ncbi:MAG: MFS transporter [Bacillota bacterium]
MKKSIKIVIFCWLAMGVLSLCANMLGPLLPDIIKDFSLSLGAAGLLPFAYFLAYAFMSTPAGMLNERFGARRTMFVAFTLSCGTAALFALAPSFVTALAMQFIFGLCMAVIEVSVFPLMRVAGGGENFAFYSVIMGLLFGAVSAANPLLYSYINRELANNSTANILVRTVDWLTDGTFPWVSMYWVLAAAFAAGALLLIVIKLPRQEEAERASGQSIFIVLWSLLKNRTIIAFFFGTFFYVGLEQSCVSWMSKFLQIYHGLDPQTEGARALSMFWAGVCLGCLLGMVLMKLVDAQKVFAGYVFAAFIVFGLALFGSKEIAIYAFPAMGFCLSVMWSVIFSLALNSVREHHEAFSGILCAGICGGAFIPFLVGKIADYAGLRTGLCLVFVCLAYLTVLCLGARPLVKNQTIFDKQ